MASKKKCRSCSASFQQYVKIAMYMKEMYKQNDEWVDRLPSDIRDAFFDNEYTNNLGLINDRLVHELFGEKLAEELYYYLVEFKGDGSDKLWIHDVSVDVSTDAKYFAWVKDHYFGEKK